MPLLGLFAVMHRLSGAAALVSRVRRLSDGRAACATRRSELAKKLGLGTGNAGRKGGWKPKTASA